MDGVQDLVHILLSPTRVDVEEDVLQDIHARLLSAVGEQAINCKNDNECEGYSSLNGPFSGDPYPSIRLDDVAEDQVVLNKFTCYVFDRRYGWSEVIGDRRVRRLSSTGATVRTQNKCQKAEINDILDIFIRWFFCHSVSCGLLKAFKYTLKTVCSMPVVRNRTVIHIMDWLKHNTTHLTEPSLAGPLIDLVILSITDVWSAVRVSCSSRLGPIASALSSDSLEDLTSKLIEICKDEASPWQAKEGTILGLNSILHLYTHIHSSHMLKFVLSDEYENVQMPDFISRQIREVVFLLLSHPQLTIRDSAVKLLSIYIACSDHKEALSTLEDVMKILEEGINIGIDNDDIYLPGQFPDAYRSEGFLNVCISVIKVLPISELLPNFVYHLSVYVMYLSHPASTVRQAASSVFKYLVLKGCHSVGLIKLVLHKLSEGWEPNLEILNTIEEKGGTSNFKKSSARPSVCDNSLKGCKLLCAWESREGRLFAYELVIKFLIKNHWLYTFGPAGAGLSNSARSWQLTSGEQSSFSREGSDLEFSTSMSHSSEFVPMPTNPPVAGSSPRETIIHASESEQSFAVRFMSKDYTDNSKRSSKKDMSKSLTLDESGIDDVTEKPLVSRIVKHSSWPSQFDNTFSALAQIQVLERAEFKESGEGSRIEGSRIESSSRNTSEGVTGVELEAMDVILKRLLFQTCECLTDTQWELRRMGQQVLPCLSEVIRWYDMSILEELWKHSLTDVTSPMTFSAMMLLRQSVLHTAKLIPLLHHPPVSWQDHENCKRIILNIVNRMKTCVPSLFDSIIQLLQRTTYDKISIMAADILITANVKFDLSCKQRENHAEVLVSFWKGVFCFAHPNTRIAKEMTTVRKHTFSSPYEGYLSCCLVRPDNDMQCARQVEKLFITETYARLSEYLQGVTVELVSSLLPLLAHYIGLYMEDSHVCRSLSECLGVAGNRTVDAINLAIDKQQKGVLLKRVYQTLKELAAIITMKSTDMHLVQKVGCLYLELCKVISPTRHLPIILVAVCARVSETIKFIVECSPRSSEDLSLLSNEIPLCYSSDSDDSSNQDITAIGSPTSSKFPECLTLNTSNNSGSFHSGRLSALSLHSGDGRSHTPTTSEKDGDSDWDSWDEEEEEVESGLNTVFADFLEKLKLMVNTGTSDAFMREVRKLGDKERTLIPKLMDD